MNKSKLRIVFILFCLSLLPSCQKFDFEEEDSKKNPQQEVKYEDDNDKSDDNDDNKGDKKDDGGSTPSRRSQYTVTQFLEEAPAFQVWVEGYIVGDCKLKIDNARFEPPFTYDTAILLADGFDKTKKGEFIPVCLKSGSNARKELNLKDNPSMYHKKIKIYALREKYYGVTGIKEIDDYEILK